MIKSLYKKAVSASLLAGSAIMGFAEETGGSTSSVPTAVADAMDDLASTASDTISSALEVVAPVLVVALGITALWFVFRLIKRTMGR